MLTGAQQVEEAVAETIAAHPEHVARWEARLPGAWGFLAGQGTLTLRRRIGRRLEDVERRQLWAALEARRGSPAS